MRNPKDLIGAIVTKLRAIPAVVSEVGGVAGVISGYEDRFPAAVNIQQAIYDLPAPGILVVWNGTSTAGARDVWTHSFSLFIKTKNAYTDLCHALLDGVAAGDSRKWWLVMAASVPNCSRRSLPVAEFVFIDYFEVTFSLSERGISA